MSLLVRRAVEGLRTSGIPVSAVATPFLVCLLCALWFPFAGLSWKLWDTLRFAASCAPFLVLTLFYSTRRPAPILAGMLGGLFVLPFAGAMAGVVALLSVSANLPTVDPVLARIDEAFGFDHPAILAWFAARPALSDSLAWAYRLSVPSLTVVVLLLATSRQTARLREFLFLFSATVLGASLISALTPAVATFTHYGIDRQVIEALPKGAGIYHMPVFEALRSGAMREFGPYDIEGVVTFPSFHCCMALMVAYGLRDMPRLIWLGVLYCAAVLVSTVPVGGHYVVDLVGGAALFAGFAWLFRRLEARRQPTGEAWVTRPALSAG